MSNLILWPSQNTGYMSITYIISIISIQITNIIAISTPNEEDPFFCRPCIIRGHGGIALGWHKKLSPHISPLHFISSCRMIGVLLNLTPSNPVVIIAVYLYTQSCWLHRQVQRSIGSTESQSTSSTSQLRHHHHGVLTLAIWEVLCPPLA